MCPKEPTKKNNARGPLTWRTFREAKGLGIGKGDEGTARSSCQAPVEDEESPASWEVEYMHNHAHAHTPVLHMHQMTDDGHNRLTSSTHRGYM